MKKIWLFLFSAFIALFIAYQGKKTSNSMALKNNPWKTFERTSNNTISAHETLSNELMAAKITNLNLKREIASDKHSQKDQALNNPHYQMRDNRILIGDINHSNYQDEHVDLEMINKISSDWKEVLGKDLLRFHKEDTKVMIKEEYPIIKIQNGKGQYLEQVVVTYLFNNGNFSSFRALIDSDTGFMTETWDKTINEKLRPDQAGLTLPEFNNSGVTAK